MQKINVLVKATVCLLAISMLGCQQIPATDQTQPDSRPLIRLAAPQNPYIQDFYTNDYKLWLEEQTGLRLEITWLPAKDAEQLAKRALATGLDLPDAYIGFESYDLFSNHNLQKLGEQGSILALDSYIEQYGTQIQTLFTQMEQDHFRELMTSSDGHIYYMPGYSSSPITRYRQVMWINQGWLNRLNLPVPKTTQEFYEVLTAFATQDANGNGILDEIPLCGTEQVYSKQPYEYLIGAFIYNNEKHLRLLKQDGRLSFAPEQDAWRQAMIYLNTLYEQGLLSPLSFTQDDQQLLQMANDPRDILGAFTTAGITRTVLQNSEEIMSRYVGIGPLQGPDGTQTASVSIPLPKPNGVITSACQYPKEVFLLFDLMLSEPACLMGRYGKEGVDWDFAQPGDISIYGTAATIRIHNQIWNTYQNRHLMQIGPYISRSKYSGGVTWDGRPTDGEYKNAQAALQYVEWEPEEYVGALIFTAQEEQQIGQIRKDLEQQVRLTIIDFITGRKDIHSDQEWLTSIQVYYDLGLKEFLDTAQVASDRLEGSFQ